VSAAIEAKALRYLSEGRLTVKGLDGQRVRAVCSGETGEWDLGHLPESGWFCTCPAACPCSHLRALQLVVVPWERL
jgi:hypothetical protein